MHMYQICVYMTAQLYCILLVAQLVKENYGKGFS